MPGFFKFTGLGGGPNASMFGGGPGLTTSFGEPPLGWGGQNQQGVSSGSSGGTSGFSAGAAGPKLDPTLLQSKLDPTLLQSKLDPTLLQSMLAQILQQGPNMDALNVGGGGGGDTGLSSALGDIQSQEDRARTSLQSRFSGMGRPLSSTEYTSQEAELIDTFRRARDSARANSARIGMAQQQGSAGVGLNQYQAQVNPLITVLRLMAGGGI